MVLTHLRKESDAKELTIDPPKRGDCDTNIAERFNWCRNIAENELENLVSAYGDGLLRYCHGILLDYYEAQDVVQNVFTAAYKALVKYNEIQSAWLYRASYNLCIDILRRKKLQSFFSLTRKEESYTEQYFIGDEVNNILQTLPPKDRALVYSRAVEGHSFEQLEAIYGKSAAALRKQYSRAKKKLVEALEGGTFHET
ncbi:MAG: sigma-70 family RNA polymerase sigma factor [Defluviitaleaceae bacterium]|nr:sigma-70 family RNA polymerase sigma factor [Defluviitaleaceae bacterium]